MNFSKIKCLSAGVFAFIVMFVFLAGAYTPDVAAADAPRMVPENFSQLAEVARPSVVNIRTEKTVQGGGKVFRHFFGNPFGDRERDPFREFFGPFEEGPSKEFKQRSLGSGFIIDNEGFIVTNNHVVEGATELVVSLADGRVLTGTIVGTDAFTDLAVVKINATDLPVAAFGDSGALRVGEVAIAIGNPVGLEFARTVTAGVISGINRLVQQGERTFTLVQTDAAINPGNSGGPLCNGSGQVIGINTIKFASTEIEGMSFAIPINIVRPIVNDLVVNGRIIRPWLGVRIVDKTNAARYGVTLDKGVLVVEVISRGPAASAGIQASDVIIAVAGQTVNTSAELTAAVQTHRVGEKIEVKVLRRGSELTYTVTLAEMQSD